MGFEIRFIGEAELPTGCSWAAARDGAGRFYLFVKVAACALLDGVLRLPAGALLAIQQMIGLLERPRALAAAV